MTTPLIWAIDLATITGLATGRVGETPIAHSIKLAPQGASANLLFVGCLHWFSDALVKGPKPDIVAIEELLPPIARRGKTSTGAQHRLAGLHGIVRALACHHDVREVTSANVLDVRQHFIHERTFKREDAKRRVHDTCKMLGWHAADDNCADALALWSYTVALINPLTALRTTPLFGSWEDVARVRQTKQRG